MLDLDLTEMPIEGLGELAPGPKAKRPPLSSDERRSGDIRIAKRLAACGRDPYRRSTRTFEDLEVEPGRIFSTSPYRERWVFPSEGGRRAARVAAEFDAFKTGRDFSTVRHFVVRPAPPHHKYWEPTTVKANPGKLQEELKRFSADFDNCISKLVNKGWIKTALTVIHVRFDTTLQKWDIHAHCIWHVEDANLEDVFTSVCKRFSKTWYDRDPIKNAAALANYITQWAIDYRQQQQWPDDALTEFWDLKSPPRLFRTGGAFAKFRRDLDGKTLVRQGDSVTVVENPPRTSYPVPFKGKERNGVVGYARVKLDGFRRLCAIRVTDRAAEERCQKNNTEIEGELPALSLAAPIIQKSDAQKLAQIEEVASSLQKYPSTSTGLTPPPPPSAPIVVKVPVPPSMAWLWQTWGTDADFVQPEQPTSRAILRRLARLCPAHTSYDDVESGRVRFELWAATRAIIKAQRERRLATKRRGRSYVGSV